MWGPRSLLNPRCGLEATWTGLGSRVATAMGLGGNQALTQPVLDGGEAPASPDVVTAARGNPQP